MNVKPYLILADLHCHAWKTFSTTTAGGFNSRLLITLAELDRAVAELRAAGGDTLYIAGDLLHTRGSMDPEVFNPLFGAIKNIAEDSIIVRIIPGNHDLKGKDTTELGNAIQSLDTIEGVEVVTNQVGRAFHITDDDAYVMMVPWQATKDQLRAVISEIMTAHGDVSKWDLIIHVGIDGVLLNVPDAGLSAAEVASWGFKRVFAGDYHNHKIMEDGKVISIGATTHQQAGDIGTKAGFLLVYPDRVEYRASHAPSFVEITGDTDPDDYPLIVDGNYVRLRSMKLTDAEINSIRKELEEMGARGVTFQVARATVSARGTSSVAKAATLDESIDKFIDTLTVEDPALLPLIKAGAADILSSVRSVAA
jgi:DNA repair exonuclease SbcCD nuclease subunit